MKWLQIGGAALLLFTVHAWAADEMRLVLPKGSSLSLVSRTGPDDVSRFRGTVAIYGTLTANWYGADGDRPYAEIVLVPSKHFRDRLPHYVLSTSHQKLTYRIGQIKITNGLEALQMAASERAGDWQRRRSGTLRVTGTFMVKDYAYWVECDAPHATALVTSVRISTSQVAGLPAPATC